MDFSHHFTYFWGEDKDPATARNGVAWRSNCIRPYHELVHVRIPYSNRELVSYDTVDESRRNDVPACRKRSRTVDWIVLSLLFLAFDFFVARLSRI